MASIAATPCAAEVAILSDYNDLWALSLQPHRKDFAYQRHQFRFYRALQHWGIPTDIVSPEADLRQYKLVIAPSAFLVDAQLAATLNAYVEGGGTLLLGVRSGFKTASNLVTDRPLPGLLRELVGATVADWHGLPPGVSYGVEYDGRGIEVGFWAEALIPDPDVDVLARFTSPPFAPRAALTARRGGDSGGCALYLGWYPTPDQAEAIVARVSDLAGVRRMAQLLPEGVVMVRRGAYAILLNFSGHEQAIEIVGQRVLVPSRDVVIID